jgi:hypothetical protein
MLNLVVRKETAGFGKVNARTVNHAKSTDFCLETFSLEIYSCFTIAVELGRVQFFHQKRRGHVS